MKITDRIIKFLTGNSNYKHDRESIINLIKKDSEINLSNFDLSNLDLSGINFENMNLIGVNFSYCMLNDTKFNMCDLSNANLVNCTLSNSLFWNTNLTNANLTNANLSPSMINNCDLTNSNLEGINLTSSNIISSNLTGAKLNNSDLFSCNFSESNLSNCNLTGAKLFETNFSTSNLSNSVGLKNKIQCKYFLDSFKQFCDEEGSDLKDVFDDIDIQEKKLLNDVINSFDPIIKKLIIPYKISFMKINGNSGYYDFTEHNGIAPLNNQMNEFLNSLGGNRESYLREKLLSYLAAPSLKYLIEKKTILTTINMGVFKLIHPKLNKFPFPPFILWSFPDVVLWLYSNGTFKKMKEIFDYDLDKHINGNGFIDNDSFKILVDKYLIETNRELECLCEW